MSLLKNISDSAKAKFQDVLFPTRKDEYWRFADFSAWSVDTLFPYFMCKPVETDGDEAFAELQKDDGAEGTIVLFDGQLLGANVPRGVEVRTMGAAAEVYPDLIEKFHNNNCGKFDLLNATRPDAGIVISVLDGESAKLSLKIISKLSVSISSVLVVLGEGSRLNLTKTNLAFGGCFSDVKCGYELAKDTTLELASQKYSSKHAITYEREDFYLGENSRLIDAAAYACGGSMRSERNFKFNKRDAMADSRAFVLGAGEFTRDIRTSQVHEFAPAKSNLEVRAALDGKANLAFTGLIRVEESAGGTEAYQACRSLMLSDDAKSQASPILEILSNDVACSHGCTVAKPSEEQMFYMAQRGINPETARTLLVRSFAETTFEKLSDRDAVDCILKNIFGE